MVRYKLECTEINCIHRPKQLENVVLKRHQITSNKNLQVPWNKPLWGNL